MRVGGLHRIIPALPRSILQADGLVVGVLGRAAGLLQTGVGDGMAARGPAQQKAVQFVFAAYIRGKQRQAAELHGSTRRAQYKQGSHLGVDAASSHAEGMPE